MMRNVWVLLVFMLSACSVMTPATDAPAVPPASAQVTPIPLEVVQPSATAEPPVQESMTQPAPPTTLPSESPADTAPPAGPAAVLPEAEDYVWERVVGGLVNPIGLENAQDGSGRLFIVEQDGRILIWKDGTLLDAPFLDIRDRVGNRGSEQGLLGLAFHPRYTENGYLYVNYTDTKGDTHIARFTVSEVNPDQADPTTEKTLLVVSQPFGNHNGGVVVFGPDGYLYLGLGDGGSGGDPQGNAQSTQTLLGKILRIDVDSGDPYGIPPDNPFASGGGLPEIWAYGLRNPWRISFDRLAGDLYIGDVGQNQWEEIDFLSSGAQPGANFGWDYREGFHPFEGAYQGNDLIDPLIEYDHSQGCSVTGGVVYRGINLQAWQGVYIYGDYCSGNVWGLLRNSDGSWQNGLLFQTNSRISSFGVDEAGEVYLVDHRGDIYHLTQ